MDSRLKLFENKLANLDTTDRARRTREIYSEARSLLWRTNFDSVKRGDLPQAQELYNALNGAVVALDTFIRGTGEERVFSGNNFFTNYFARVLYFHRKLEEFLQTHTAKSSEEDCSWGTSQGADECQKC